MGRTGKIFIDNKEDTLQIMINSKPPSLRSQLVLSVLALFCFSFPIYILLLDKVPIGFGFIITILIFGGSGVYFTRKLLWNTVGKEVYQIINSEITYYYNYWVFNDNKQITPFLDLKFGYATLDEPYIVNEFSENSPSEKDNSYLAAFIIGEIPIISNIPLNTDDIIKFKNVAKRYCSIP